MTLAETQKRFLRAFQHQQPEAFASAFKANNKLSAADMVGIYHDGIAQGLLQALLDIYPVSEKLVGKAFFQAMGLAYVREHASTSPSLFDYGDSFADFVRDFVPALSLPYLGDVCALEWLHHRAYYAAEGGAGEAMAGLSGLPPEQQAQVVLYTPDSMGLVRSPYPIDAIWHANQSEDPQELSLDRGEVHLAVLRRDALGGQKQVEIKLVSEALWLLLQAIQQGASLVRLGQLFGEDCSENLGLALQQGYVVGFGID